VPGTNVTAVCTTRVAHHSVRDLCGAFPGAASDGLSVLWRDAAGGWFVADRPVVAVKACGPRRWEILRREVGGRAFEVVSDPGLEPVAMPRWWTGLAFDEEVEGDWVPFGAARATLFGRTRGVLPDGRGFEQTVEGLSPVEPGAGPGPAAAPQGVPPRYAELVGRAIEACESGRLEKVVVSGTRDVAADRCVAVATALSRLAERFEGCSVFGFAVGDQVFAGATPELLVGVSDRRVASMALAGSAPRGGAHDAARIEALASSLKEQAEHAFVRHAVAARLGPLCDEVSTTPSPRVWTLPNIHHLRSDVTAVAHDGVGILDLAERLQPTPAVCGMPHEAARAFIRSADGPSRGWYAGSVGWVDASGNGELAVALRSALIGPRGARLFAGVGVVRGSDISAELAETDAKFSVMLDALRPEAP
jgi:isochorismate synthase